MDHKSRRCLSHARAPEACAMLNPSTQLASRPGMEGAGMPGKAAMASQHAITARPVRRIQYPGARVFGVSSMSASNAPLEKAQARIRGCRPCWFSPAPPSGARRRPFLVTSSTTVPAGELRAGEILSVEFGDIVSPAIDVCKHDELAGRYRSQSASPRIRAIAHPPTIIGPRQGASRAGASRAPKKQVPRGTPLVPLFCEQGRHPTLAPGPKTPELQPAKYRALFYS